MLGMEVLEGQKRAALSATISYYIKKFLTIPVILRIITSLCRSTYKHCTQTELCRILLTAIPWHREGGGRQSALSRKQQVCVQQSKQIKKSKGVGKKALLHWIDLTLSVWCQRNGFFSPVRQSFLQKYDVSVDY